MHTIKANQTQFTLLFTYCRSDWGQGVSGHYTVCMITITSEEKKDGEGINLQIKASVEKNKKYKKKCIN